LTEDVQALIPPDIAKYLNEKFTIGAGQTHELLIPQNPTNLNSPAKPAFK
ncbi:MAG: hypothetical protein ACI9IL_000191, partial [Rickettsiales bacterium]